MGESEKAELASYLQTLVRQVNGGASSSGGASGGDRDLTDRRLGGATRAGGSKKKQNESVDNDDDPTATAPPASWRETAADWQLRDVLNALGKSTTGDRAELIQRIQGSIDALKEPASSIADNLRMLIAELEKSKSPGAALELAASQRDFDGSLTDVDVRALISRLRDLRRDATELASKCAEMDPVAAVHSPSRGLGALDGVCAYIPFVGDAMAALSPLYRAEVNGELKQGFKAARIVAVLSRCTTLMIQVTSATATERNNCLLYTSPSPRDATLSRMPSSA